MQSYEAIDGWDEEDNKRTLGFSRLNDVDGFEVSTRPMKLIATFSRDTWSPIGIECRVPT